tara:strand:- start:99 stop:560 length:462 start_codon:yes stop_codon:yes gene_type:complete
MKLLNKLSTKNIILPLEAQNKSDAIKKILTHLQNNYILKKTTNLLSYIENNEKKNSSAVGRGIAYPHSTSTEINELTCILALSKKGIDFNCPDNQLCHIILLTLSSKFEPNEHRKYITRFRNMIKNPNVRLKILESKKTINIINVIQRWEDDN